MLSILENINVILVIIICCFVGMGIISLCLILIINFTPFGKLGKFLPYRPRFINWLWAFHGGFFWKECPLCNKKFGGHEKSGYLMKNWHSGKSVCRKCIDFSQQINIENMKTWEPIISKYYSEKYIKYQKMQHESDNPPM